MQRERQRLVEVRATIREVGAVDREAGEHLGDRVLQLRDAVREQVGKLAHDPPRLGQQAAQRHVSLAVVDQPVPVQVAAAQRGVQFGQWFLARRVGEHPVEQGEGVVPRGAVHRPAVDKFLTGLKDLLDQRVAATGEGGQVVEVALGVAQPVGVVDAQPVDEVLLEPATDLDVRGREHLGHLDPDTGEGGDGEEAAVVEVGVTATPADQLVVLLGQRGGPGSHRKAVLVVADDIAVDLDRALVVITEHGQQHLAEAELPVDVEGLRVHGSGPVLEEVPPPRVCRRGGHPDVVGHDVDEDAHAETSGLGRQGRKTCGATTRVVHPVERDHVVAVGAAGLSGQQGREIDPVDPEFVQVGQPARRLEQVEVGVDLEPVRRGRPPWAWPTGHVRLPPWLPPWAASDAATEWSGSVSGSRCSRSTTTERPCSSRWSPAA